MKIKFFPLLHNTKNTETFKNFAKTELEPPNFANFPLFSLFPM